MTTSLSPALMVMPSVPGVVTLMPPYTPEGPITFSDLLIAIGP